MDDQAGPADPRLDRYAAALARYQRAETEVCAAADARAQAVLELGESGLTRRQVAAMLGMTAAMVQKLHERGLAARGRSLPAAQQENSFVEGPPAPELAPVAAPVDDGASLF